MRHVTEMVAGFIKQKISESFYLGTAAFKNVFITYFDTKQLLWHWKGLSWFHCYILSRAQQYQLLALMFSLPLWCFCDFRWFSMLHFYTNFFPASLTKQPTVRNYERFVLVLLHTLRWFNVLWELLGHDFFFPHGEYLIIDLFWTNPVGTFNISNEELIAETVSVPLPTDLVSFFKPLLHNSLSETELLDSEYLHHLNNLICIRSLSLLVIHYLTVPFCHYLLSRISIS